MAESGQDREQDEGESKHLVLNVPSHIYEVLEGLVGEGMGDSPDEVASKLVENKIQDMVQRHMAVKAVKRKRKKG